MDRYARQQIIAGWDQSVLSRATLLIAGSGWTGFLTALMATAMGFGRIVIVGKRSAKEDEVGLARLVQGSRKAWCDFLSRINPDVRLYPAERDLDARMIARLSPDVVIVADARRVILRTAAQLADDGLPVSCGWAAGMLGFWGAPQPDRITDRLALLQESPVVGQIIAGLLVEEARKAVLPLPTEAGRTESRQLFVPDGPARDVSESRRDARLCQGDVSVIGAGALGTWFGLACGTAGIHRKQIHLYDDDVVDATNLNRQILFFGAVGKPKATVLVQRLQKLFPRTKWCGYGMRVDANTYQHVDANSILVACPDSFQVRGFLNDLARTRTQPLLNGGTSAEGGSCYSYVPGVTACLQCSMGIDRLVQREAEPRPCAQQVEASVVTSNAIAGALMVSSLQAMTSGQVRQGQWGYDGQGRDVRLGRHLARPPCGCHCMS